MFNLALLLILSCSMIAPAQTKPEPLDGPTKIFHDELLDHLQGKWKVTGTIAGHPAEMEITAEWVLNHQFLHVHEKGLSTGAGRPEYEADVYLGYDNTSDRYVAHWIDIYGGRFSETLGYGMRSGNTVKFNFVYPDGPFHNSFTWDAAGKSWHFFLEQKNTAGKWTTFADQTATRADNK